MPQKRTSRRSERRVTPRADARLSMRVEGAPDGEPTQIVTESQNISANGVYCTSSHFLAPLSRVSLTIVLPSMPGGRGAKELIKCDGIVVRCQAVSKRSEKAWELACMFSGLDDKRRTMLDQFVTWRNLQALRAAAAKVVRTDGRPRARTTATRKRTVRRAVARRGTVH